MDLSLPLAAWIGAAVVTTAQAPPAQAPATEPSAAVLPAVLPYLARVECAEDTPGFGRAARAETLARTRGGADTTVANEMQLSGTVSNNSANNFTTGSNLITAGSFANAAGLPTVIQNSGANVLIQNATIINLQMH